MGLLFEHGSRPGEQQPEGEGREEAVSALGGEEKRGLDAAKKVSEILVIRVFLSATLEIANIVDNHRPWQQQANGS